MKPGPESASKDMCRTLILDEVSGLDDTVYSGSNAWAGKKLVILSPRPHGNFFKEGANDDR